MTNFKTLASLSSACEFILDGTHGSPERTQTGIPVLSAQNVVDGRLALDTDRFTSQEEYMTYRRRLDVRREDVLLTIVGSIGRTAVVETDEPFLFQRSVAVLRPKNSVIHSRYLFHGLSTPFVQAQLKKKTNQSSQAGIYLGKLGEVEIPLPPLSVQKRIADILDKADSIRRKRKDVDNIAASLLPSVFTEMFGDAGSDYDSEPLDRHLEFLTSGSRGWAEHYVKSGKRFLRSLDVQMNRIGTDDVAYVNPPPGTEADRTRVKDGDVLVTITGSRIGRVAFIPESFGEAYVSQHVAIARLKPTLLPRYCSMFLSLQNGGQRQIAKAQYGQTKPGLSLTNIREFQIPIPPVKEQQRFLNAWNKHAKLMLHQGESSNDTQALFDSLVQKAFRGDL